MAMDVVSLRNLLSPLVGEKITYIKLLDKSYYLNYILRLVGNDSITIYGEGNMTPDYNGSFIIPFASIAYIRLAGDCEKKLSDKFIARDPKTS